MSSSLQRLRVPGGRVLLATPVLETYWRFAAERQEVFFKRVRGDAPPWTDDAVLARYRFTNAYRAADRVSQYLIKHVIYEGPQRVEEVFFRVLLFKLFNRIETWQALLKHLGTPKWDGFDCSRYNKILDNLFAAGQRLYSAAYIMPSPRFGRPRKHQNHLALLEHLMRTRAPRRVARAHSLEAVFQILRDYPSLGDFLAFQFTIDLNYSEIIDFPEMDFVVAGPGSCSGIRKCFDGTGGLDEAEVIRVVAECAESEFNRHNISFRSLWGRPLQLIDYQNLFCEVDKYARVAHPDVKGRSMRVRIKQRFWPNLNALPQWYPPKWGLPVVSSPSNETRSFKSD